jgi:hypothetical protein
LIICGVNWVKLTQIFERMGDLKPLIVHKAIKNENILFTRS